MHPLTSPPRRRRLPRIGLVALAVVVAAELVTVVVSRSGGGEVAVVAGAAAGAVDAIPPDGDYAYLDVGVPGDDAASRALAEEAAAQARRLGFDQARAVRNPGVRSRCFQHAGSTTHVCADAQGPGGYTVVLDGPFPDAPPPPWAPDAVPPDQSLAWHEAKQAEVDNLARARGLEQRAHVGYLEFSVLKHWTPPVPGQHEGECPTLPSC